jgi:hypothetical protein
MYEKKLNSEGKVEVDEFMSTSLMIFGFQF